MTNKVAPEGQVFVCAACGKKSKDRYGDQKIDSGWDESCILNSVLCYERDKPPYAPVDVPPAFVRQDNWDV